MPELTDEQKEECQRVMNTMIDYWWERIEIKMETVTFEEALAEVLEAIRNG